MVDISPFELAAFSAGASPKRVPDNAGMPSEKKRTPPSMLKSVNHGPGAAAWIGVSAPMAGSSQNASRTPAPPPAKASSRLSVRSCWTMRERPAPSDRRMAISVSRDTPRASSRLATLAQQISSRKPTATPSARRSRSALPSRSARYCRRKGTRPKDAERRQVGCRHRRGHHALRFTLTHQMELPLRRQPGRGERPGLVAVESVVEEGSAERIETFAQRHPEDEAVDVRDWQRAQEQGVECAEDRRVRADAERESDHHHRCEPWPGAEGPQPVAHVLPEAVHRPSSEDA